MSRTRCLVAALAACVSFVGPAAADVSTRVRILNDVQGFLGFYTEVPKTAPFVVSDLLTRDDAFSKSTSFASADLGTGELKVNATGFSRQPYTNAFIAQATAAMSDVLTIVGPGNQPIPISLFMTVDGLHGTPAASAGEGRAVSFVRGRLDVGSDFETAELQRATSYDATGAVISNVLTGVRDWVGAQPLPGTSNEFSMVMQFDTTITPNVPFSFASEIFASVSYAPPNPNVALLATPILADFGNTAVLSIVLPPSYDLTSQSGVFLAGPIPEPHVWAMMIAGTVCVGCALCRRARRSMLGAVG